MTNKTTRHGRMLLTKVTPGDWKIRTNPRTGEPGFVQAPRIDPTHPYDIEVLGEDDTLYSTRNADMELIVWLKNNAEWLFDLIDERMKPDV